MIVRPATPADVPVMAALARAAYQGYVPAVGREPAPMHADYAALVEAGSVLVAADGDAVVGLLVLLPRPDHLLLDNIAVAPGRQRAGIGTVLLARAESRAAALGLREVRLYTHETMADNLAWYTRHGYVVTHRAIEDDFRRVFLTKQLTQP